jgi:excisionase family DNA binding protein
MPEIRVHHPSHPHVSRDRFVLNLHKMKNVKSHSASPATSRGAGELTTREAARLLGVSLRTVQLWVEGGVLSAWKTPGGHRRISQSSVDAVLGQRRAGYRPDAAGQAPLRVVVVDDDADLLRLYTMQLQGFQPPLDVTTASNGYEGLVRVGEIKPDLLITDLMMPGVDGFMMLQALQSDRELRGMRILVVTGMSEDAIRDRGGLPPHVAMFPKPLKLEQLEAFIRGILSGRPQPA